MNAPYHVFVFGKLLVSRYLNGLKKVTTLVILCCPGIKRGNSNKYMIDGIVPTSLKEYHCWNKELFGKFWALKPCSLLLIHQIGGPQTRQNHFYPLQCMQNAKGKPSSPTRLGKVEPGGALSSTLPCQ